MIDDYVIRILSVVIPVIGVVLADGRWTRFRMDQLDRTLREHISDGHQHETPRPARHGR